MRGGGRPNELEVTKDPVLKELNICLIFSYTCCLEDCIHIHLLFQFSVHSPIVPISSFIKRLIFRDDKDTKKKIQFLEGYKNGFKQSILLTKSGIS